MTNVSNIHYSFDWVSIELQNPLENICKNIGSGVTNMGIVIYRRSTSIKANPLGQRPSGPAAKRPEFFNFSREEIVKFKRHLFTLLHNFFSPAAKRGTQKIILLHNFLSRPSFWQQRDSTDPVFSIAESLLFFVFSPLAAASLLLFSSVPPLLSFDHILYKSDPPLPLLPQPH